MSWFPTVQKIIDLTQRAFSARFSQRFALVSVSDYKTHEWVAGLAAERGYIAGGSGFNAFISEAPV
ncbi:MAG: hypothetical protein ACR2JC_00200 [Chloroflexota bacterium]|nr:MAG: hypothetical protein DLM70_05690 [Chloroflexota bacterium]